MKKLAKERQIEFRNHAVKRLIASYPLMDFAELGNLTKIFEKALNLALSSKHKIFQSIFFPVDISVVGSDLSNHDAFDIYKAIMETDNVASTQAHFWTTLCTVYNALYRTTTAEQISFTIQDEIQVTFIWNPKKKTIVGFTDHMYSQGLTIQDFMDNMLYAICNGAKVGNSFITMPEDFGVRNKQDMLIQIVANSFILHKLQYAIVHPDVHGAEASDIEADGNSANECIEVLDDDRQALDLPVLRKIFTPVI